MAQQRTWDESRSPQWRYLLSKESQGRREREKTERENQYGEDTVRKRVSKRKKLTQERHQEKRKLKKQTKAGREIVYSASPGGESNRYHNKEFAEASGKNVKDGTIKIFNKKNNNETTK